MPASPHRRTAAVRRAPAGNSLDIGVHVVQGYRGRVHVVDWTNPEAVRVMAEEYQRLFATGASVVKADLGEELPVEAVYADGTPGERMHNLYPLRYQQAVHAATAAARGERERIAWSRSGWAGAQRYPVHWGGDVPPAWETMLPQLHGGLSLGLSGFTFWSADQSLCGRLILVAPLFEPGGRRRLYLPAGTWTDWWTRRRVRGPRWEQVGQGLDTMPLLLREGAVVPMGPVMQWVGERPTDPLTVLVAPFQRDGRTELRLPLDGREVTIRDRARAGRHRVTLDGHPGLVLLDAPAGVELRP
jgi:alpha-glucosidase (family GH31 glycosyl hydrolase)